MKNAQGAASALAAARALPPSPTLLSPELLGRPPEVPSPSRAPASPVKAKVRRFELVLSPEERATLLALTDRADAAIRGTGSDEGVPVSRAEILRALLAEVATDDGLEARVHDRIRAERT